MNSRVIPVRPSRNIGATRASDEAERESIAFPDEAMTIGRDKTQCVGDQPVIMITITTLGHIPSGL